MAQQEPPESNDSIDQDRHALVPSTQIHDSEKSRRDKRPRESIERRLAIQQQQLQLQCVENRCQKNEEKESIVVCSRTMLLRKRIFWGACFGAVFGFCLAVCVTMMTFQQHCKHFFRFLDDQKRMVCPSNLCSPIRGSHQQQQQQRRRLSRFSIQTYLDLFGKGGQQQQDEDHFFDRSLAASDQPTGPLLVIAGKMTFDGSESNIGQMDLQSMKWSSKERVQLSLYASYSGAEVYSLLANHSLVVNASVPGGSAYEGSGELIVVGAFDTTYRNSQVLYCSVGRWNGMDLQKVGEGLCNSAVSRGMKITTAAFAGPENVYVAGSFDTQVWNGNLDRFVKIFNIAHYNAATKVWLPLNVGQITCSWCTVTVLALAWDAKRRQLNIAGKFDAINGVNVPAGLAVYDLDSGRLLAHPGGGLAMLNITQDGVGTALQLDEDKEVLYVMGSFERLTSTYEVCYGMAAYEIRTDTWTCLADAAHSVLPTGGGNMLLTPYGLMVGGLTTSSTTWTDSSRPYTIALLKTTRKNNIDDKTMGPMHEYRWTWLPGFKGHDEPLHALSNGFGAYYGTVFIGGDNLVAQWYYHQTQDGLVPVTEDLSAAYVRGAIMAISQMTPKPVVKPKPVQPASHGVNYSIIVYCVSIGTVIGMLVAIMVTRNGGALFLSIFNRDAQLKGISLDTLSYTPFNRTTISEAYKRAMRTRYVQEPHLLTLIDPQEIFLQRIIGEGTFGRVWSARWKSSKVAVKEFVFAQAAVAGRSKMQGEIIEEIIGEAGMMAILRHPNVLQLFGCSLTAQAIWIVSELCSLGSLRQLLDSTTVGLPLALKMNMALQVAEGMTYLHNQPAPIIHRDLKSHNIFVHETFTEADDTVHEKPIRDTENGGMFFRFKADIDHRINTQSTIVVKIGDWGSARATLSGSRTMTHGVGTACWLAPEVIKHARSSKFSDVYSFGIVLWELATREEVYQGLEATQIIAMVANDGLRPPVPNDCPWDHLMVKCWAENPLDRMDFSQVVEAFNDLLRDLTPDKRSQTHLTQEAPT